MAKSGIHRLTVPQVRNAKKAGRLHDGGGLYLQVTVRRDAEGGEHARKSWVLIYTGPDGVRREMGLGGVERVELKGAREAADKARKLLGAGVDPLEQRKADKAEEALKRARSLTFKEAATRYIEAQKPGWKNPKHAKLWTTTLETYANPTLGALAVASISVEDVLRTLEPVWSTKPETASKVRGRIEAVLDWCSVRGYRERDTRNPAAWRGNLQKALPARSKVRAVRHHPALPYADMGAFMPELRALDGLGALALELTILTAVRTNEALGAQWSEFDLEGALWEIPAARMKGRRSLPHRVPLSRQAVALLWKLHAIGNGKGWVFPGLGTKRPLSGMSMLKTLERMGRDAITVHGFRSSFKDWAADTTSHPREIVEAALAHVAGDAVEVAYRRGDALEKRKRLMQSWADYCDRPPVSGSVVDLKRKQRAGDA